MASRSSFLTTRFGGYYHRHVPQEDVELTHIEPDTPCGEYLRRYWQPVCFSDELQELPLRVKLLGEDLVAFRDFSGAVGVLELHCPHRGTSLEFGLVSDQGIRCCYHGWLFDVDGAILETPGEPADSTLKDRLCHGAYPTHEYNGIVFVYMGPPEQKPPFPIYDSYTRPGYRLIPGRKYFYPCNWLQILENAMDPVHTAFLHTIVSGSQFTDEFGEVPELDFLETPVGIIYVATRRVDENVWARMVEIVAPNLQQVAPIWEDGKVEHPGEGAMMSRWIVPVDNANTMFIEFRHVNETEGATRHGGATATSCFQGNCHLRLMRRASASRVITRPKWASVRLRSTASNISALPTAGLPCFGVNSGAGFVLWRKGETPMACLGRQGRSSRPIAMIPSSMSRQRRPPMRIKSGCEKRG